MASTLTRQDLRGLLFWLAASYVTAAIGSVASINAADFYAQLNRPAWAPPSAVFGPVWTVLYFLIGLSGWLAWRKRGPEAAPLPYVLFFAQLAVNALWSWLFFAWHLGLWAFIDVIVLDLLIIATMLQFSRINILAAWALVPYLCWVCFASLLTFAVWQRNPGLL